MSIFEREPVPYSGIEQMERGKRAERLLSDDLLREAHEAAEWKLVERMAHQSSTRDEREAAFAGLHAMSALFAALREIVEAGQIAQSKIK